jgi:hypothetical protein
MLWGIFRFIYPYYLRNPLFIGLLLLRGRGG